MPDNEAALNVHATCVAVDGKGVLITGRSGSGKSTLALQLMALGATLVSDDRTELCDAGHAVIASAPAPLKGLIEARGVGLLKAQCEGSVKIALVVDLDADETERLPDARWARYCDQDLPCLHKIAGAHFPAAILQYLRAGRWEPK